MSPEDGGECNPTAAEDGEVRQKSTATAKVLSKIKNLLPMSVLRKHWNWLQICLKT